MAEPIYYLIDTSVVVRQPEVLSMARVRKLVIPDVVIQELFAFRSNRWRPIVKNLIEQAVSAGAEVMRAPVKLTVEPSAPGRLTQGLSSADIEIARTAISLVEAGRKVCVITFDNDLHLFLNSQRIPSTTPEQFLKLKDNKLDVTVAAAAKSFTGEQNSYFAGSFLFAICAGTGAIIIYDRRAFLLETLSVWGTILALLATGVFFYWYRQRSRLSYGILEFFFGAVAAVWPFWPHFTYVSLGVFSTVQIVGGLYVMVRGLDNIGKGVEGTRFENQWRWMFKDI